MKTKYTVALGMLASFALGAVAVQNLHAQAKPVAYVVGEVAVTNQEAYAKEFLPLVVKTIEDAGGKYLARGGNTISFRGAPLGNRIVILQFESLDKAQAWWNSSDTKDAFDIGRKYATFRNYAIESCQQLKPAASSTACPSEM